MAEISDLLDAYLNKNLISNKRRTAFHLKTLFKNVDLRNKNVLDIGGGNGLLSNYAAVTGAKRVVLLEPEFDGSHAGIVKVNMDMQEKLALGNIVSFKDETFQNYDNNGLAFDVVLLHNSVNHLDEEACEGLATNLEYQERYCSLFKKMYEMMSPNAILMLCDCSSKNFFPQIGLKNPFWKNIEWHKHQPPEQWIDLLRKVGFTQPRIRWSSYNFLFTPGRILTGNRFVSYFLLSHFSLSMVKEAA